jgi:hypothetical protein
VQERFADLLELEIPSWIFCLESVNPTDFAPLIQEELIEATNDEELKAGVKRCFKSAWFQIENRYKKLFAIAQPLLIGFHTSYLCEAAFSHVEGILSKKRNRLDIVKRGDLRLKLTNIAPRVQQLAHNIQGQGSH